MDLSDSTKIVLDRIQKLEPDNVSKIIGYLLLQDEGGREMIRLAFSPDHILHSLINKAKVELGLSPRPPVSVPIPTASINLATPISDHPLQFPHRSFSSPATFRAAPYWDPQIVTDQQPIHNVDFVPSIYADLIGDEYRHHNQAQFMNLDDQLDPINAVGAEISNNYFYPESVLTNLNARANRRSPSLPEFPIKTCHYFNKGYCKHGTNCRYFHGQAMPESFSQILSMNQNEMVSKDHGLSTGSLEKLELELTELLKSRRGMPVSIASLPMMYYEKYGKNLQADGYLTESQRHGKAGYSLTKLLARLKNSIRLIDRPHGQHSVVLAEDAPRYMEYKSERSDPGGIVAGSRQIYLTFPAESTFTEEDVSNYFKSFGPVQDVRIPCQQKRMFGFVTFMYPETVKLILTKGNPHFVCGARVLVKPYREKSRLVDRKYSEKIEPPAYYHFLDMDPELHSMPRICDNSRLLRKQFIEEHEQVFELERRRLSELHLVSKTLNHPYAIYPMEDLKVAEDHDFTSADRFNYLLDVMNNGSTSEDKARLSTSNYSDPDSQVINLPESPFASPVASSISAVI
ncbi:hypothetical protein AAC387_Pa09g2417 [Persea americana]